MKASRTSLTAGALTVALIVTAQSQSGPQERDHLPSNMTPCQTITTADATCLFDGPLVRGAPFTATVTTTWTPPAGSGLPRLQSASRYYRDANGRARVEQLVTANGPQQIIVSTGREDEFGQGVYRLLPADRTFIRQGRVLAEMLAPNGATGDFILAVSPTVLWHFSRMPGATAAFNANEAPLGEGVMGGLRVLGMQFTALRGSGSIGTPKDFTLTDERWVSDQLKLVVYARSEDSYYGVLEHRVTDVRLDAPRPELFKLPLEYTEGQTPATTWRNPYRAVFLSRGGAATPARANEK